MADRFNDNMEELTNCEEGRDATSAAVALAGPKKASIRKEWTKEHHFSTDHLLDDLKERTVSSGVVTVSSQAGRFLLNLGYTMTMARLLTPGEFGVVAMVTTVTAVAGMVADTGLSTVTLQRQHITHAQVSNLFWINVAVSGLLTIILMACAPAFAFFYHEPRVKDIAVVLSMTFLFAGFTAQHLALLSRRMRFKAKAGVELGSVSAGSCTGIVMALLGYGYWSLVGALMVTAAVNCLLAWTVSGWRPQKPTRDGSTMPLIGFGANLSIGNLAYSLARCSDGLLVGRFFGAGALGLYSRASVLLMRPLEQLLRPIDAVLEPALARVQSQPERYRRIFLQVYRAIALTGFLFTGLFLALVRPLVLVTLGPKWEGAEAIVAGFTLVALFFPLAKASEWLFTSQGRGRDALKGRLAQSLLSVLAFLGGLPYGPVGIAVAFSISCLLIQLPILNYLAGRSGPVRTADLWAGFLEHLPIWLVVFAVTKVTCVGVSHSAPLTQVVVSGAAGSVAGLAFTLLFPPTRRTALMMFNLLKGIRSFAPLRTASKH